MAKCSLTVLSVVMDFFYNSLFICVNYWCCSFHSSYSDADSGLAGVYVAPHSLTPEKNYFEVEIIDTGLICAISKFQWRVFITKQSLIKKFYIHNLAFWFWCAYGKPYVLYLVYPPQTVIWLCDLISWTWPRSWVIVIGWWFCALQSYRSLWLDFWSGVDLSIAVVIIRFI